MCRLYLCDMIQFRQTDIYFYYFYQNESEQGTADFNEDITHIYDGR